jgi:hypothetical protein
MIESDRPAICVRWRKPRTSASARTGSRERLRPFE